MFRFAHPELLYLLIVIPLLIVFYVVMIRRKKKAIAEFGNPELLGPLILFCRSSGARGSSLC